MRRPAAAGALLALLPLLAVAACGGPPEPPSGPPDLAYGQEMCARCGMSIDDPRFAAAMRVPGGRRGQRLFVYDDLGEMFLDMAAREGTPPSETWVHDGTSGRWIEGRRARYVRGRISTPMGIGVEAYADAGAATRRAGEVDGEVLDFDALLEMARRGELEAKPNREEAR